MPAYYGSQSSEIKSGAFDEMYGYDGHDKLTSTVAGALIDGGSGNDYLGFGRLAWGTLYGGTGLDALFGGADGDNILDGGSGSDYILGAAGTDLGVIEIDYMFGGSEADSIYGGVGRDYIYGGDGDDSGGPFLALFDLYGIRANFGLFGDVGEDYLDGGNGKDYVHGGEGQDVIHGGAGTYDDTLCGGGDGDTIYGGSGNDLIYHGDDLSGAYFTEDGGDDLLEGGAGNDTYMVGEGDVVVEHLYSGTDTVYIVELYYYYNEPSYALGSQQEVEYLTCFDQTNTQDWRLTGSATANTITGNAGHNELYGLNGADKLYGLSGHDWLDGGLGADTMTGSDGWDKFVFSTAPDATNADKITDFDPGDDTIVFDTAVFSAIDPNMSTDDYYALFCWGTSAQESADRILYDQNSGNLWYDPDGTGAAAQIKVAVLLNKPDTIFASDFDFI